MSARGVVASGDRATTEAALAMLAEGGNAFDAAVAAGFAAALAEPALTSLGGGGFLLARTAEGRDTLFDFFADTPGRELPRRALTPHFVPVTVRFPGSEQVFNTGLGSVAVPGAVAGYLRVHRELGRLPLRHVVAPAVRLAREGVALSAHQAYFLGLLEPIVTHSRIGRGIFAPTGRLAREGERIVNAELAAFLEALPDSGRDLYEGETARRIARDMREGDGLLTEADLAAFEVFERSPLEARYRDHRLLTNPPPSFGGSLLALSLRLLERASLPRVRPASREHTDALLAVMREVEALRASGWRAPEPSDEETGSASPRVFGRGTTHVSVCDAAGNAASMSTSNGEGSGYFVPGTGIMLNNMLGEDDLHPDGFHVSPPGQRVASMMSPSMLLRGEELRAVLGSGGSKRIRTVLMQVVSLLVDFDLPVRAAVERPRFHWDGERVQVEPGLPPEALEALRASAGADAVNEWDRPDIYFGGVHAVAPGGAGAGDPRRGGHAAEITPEEGES